MRDDTLVIFDCFGVVCSELAPPWFAMHFDGETADRLKHGYFDGADRGELSVTELLDRVSHDFGMKRETIEAEWRSIFHLHDELIALIGRLHGVCNTALLSNACEGIVEYMFDRHGLWGLFDKTFMSWRYGIVKPDPRFYKTCVDSFGKHFERVYMIDDNHVNLVGLEALGITPVHYTDVSDVKHALNDILA